GDPFSRSYGVKLPSSLTRGLPFTWVSSTCPPVSVCGTGTGRTHDAGFLDRPGARRLGQADARPFRSRLTARSRGFPTATRLPASTRPLHRHAAPPPRHAASLQTHAWWYRNTNRLSIAYAPFC